MKGLLEKDHPILIVEDNSPELSVYLAEFGFSFPKSRRLKQPSLPGRWVAATLVSRSLWRRSGKPKPVAVVSTCASFPSDKGVD